MYRAVHTYEDGGSVLFVCNPPDANGGLSIIHVISVSMFVCYHPILVCVCIVSCSLLFLFLPSTPTYCYFFVPFLVHYCFLFSDYIKCLLTLRACLLVLPRLSGRVCCYRYNEVKKNSQ